MAEKYTKEKAIAAVRRFIVENCPTQYLRCPIEQILAQYQDRVYIPWESVWGANCTLYFSMENELSISWSATGRSVTSAIAAISMYRMVTEFAAHLECKRQEEMERVKRSEEQK